MFLQAREGMATESQPDVLMKSRDTEKHAERTCAPLSVADSLVQYGSNCLAKSRLIGGIENAQSFKDKILFEGGKNGFNRGGLQQIGCSPLAYPNFAQAEW
jgi:hypothetical protein